MNAKISKATKSKKGFTLVELVIVIAILAILSAIAVPIVTTLIMSSKLSVMQSDCETINMMVMECRNNYLTHNRTTTYGENSVTAATATLEDVCYTCNLDYSNGDLFTRTIGADTYQMVYRNGKVLISGNGMDCGNPVANVANVKDGDCLILSESTLIADLEKITK